MTVVRTQIDPTMDPYRGFVRRQGTELVDDGGAPLLLRGVGIGNWLLPEGYMWGFLPHTAESPREIESLIERLTGHPFATWFWEEFRKAFFNENDVARIAAAGFDHIRLPLNARYIMAADGRLTPSGGALIDKVIEWCRAYRLRVLLDLHGAPGGQTGTNIDDSLGKPALYLDRRNWGLATQLWRDLARRYRHETAVLGYDLLNEPLPHHWQYTHATEAVELYRLLTEVIREEDPNHLIQYQGTHWATNVSIFTDVWDENSCIQFHRYRCTPDADALRPFLQLRDDLDLPLFMGEGGEGTPEWHFAAFRLYEAHRIGWNFWTWKKIDSVTSPARVESPNGWADIIAAANGKAQVAPARARQIFTGLLERFKIENCTWLDSVTGALFAHAPTVIPVWAVGHRGDGQSYSVAEGRAMPTIRRDAAINLAFAYPGPDNPVVPFRQFKARPIEDHELLVAHLRAGDWLEFEVTGIDPTAWVAVGTMDEPVPARIERSERGLRLIAEDAVTVARIRLRD